jgi:hypothetical protein
MAWPLSADSSLLDADKPSDPIVRPDIDWIPSYRVYKDRVERLEALGLDRPAAVPKGRATFVARIACGLTRAAEC